MTDDKIIATERIDKKLYRLVLIPVYIVIILIGIIMAYGQAVVTDDLYDISHWLIWGTLISITSFLLTSLYNDAVTPKYVYEDGIVIHVIHINPFAKRNINFSDVEKVVAAEGPKGGFDFYIYLKNGKKYHKGLYSKIKKGKVIEDNKYIIKLIESKTKDRFKWITWDEWVHTKF